MARCRPDRSRLTAVALLVALSCCAKAPSPQAPPPAAQPASFAEAAQDAGESTAPLPRQLVRTGQLGLRVESTERVAESVQERVEAAGGYVSELRADSHEGGLHSFHIQVRVPVESFDAILVDLKSLAEEVYEEVVTTEDVTDRFVDLEARLRTLEATEKELLALLAESRERGRSTEDIMAVYAQLTEIRTRIEQLQGQLNLLTSQVRFSTLTVELWPSEWDDPLAGTSWRPLRTARRSVAILLATLRGLGNLLIFATIVLAPVALLVGVPVWLAVRALRRRRGA